jgi:hypothetical protein
LRAVSVISEPGEFHAKTRRLKEEEEEGEKMKKKKSGKEVSLFSFFFSFSLCASAALREDNIPSSLTFLFAWS